MQVAEKLPMVRLVNDVFTTENRGVDADEHPIFPIEFDLMQILAAAPDNFPDSAALFV